MVPWPRPIPARLKPAGPDDLFVMTLGAVETPLADGVFDPGQDRVTLNDGAVIEHYYRQHLNVPFYQPIDKSAFPLPPSGWCSWYFYYQEVDAEEVLANARWITEHLKDHGLRYVQIDDGWQGVGRGGGENRDWTTINERFRKLGMDGLAAEIRRLGLEPGIWLCPHGQSNEHVVHASGAFLLKPDGTSASDTWEGRFLVDPTASAGHAYLHELFKALCDWGYTYFKIDGQPMVLEEYAKVSEFLGGGKFAKDTPPAELYRHTLRTIRAAIGPDRYLLGCWGTPLPGIGIMDGSRTALDVGQSWEGFLVANDAVQDSNFLHNVAWYCDPDVCLVRPPLTDGMARAWATLQGLTGQALLTSDRLPDLPPARVELLRRIYPAVDIRPLDLFAPEHPRKPIWLLKVAHQEVARTYDVVGVFNYDAERAQTHHLSWAALGLDPGRPHHVYDFWQQTYLGAWENGVFIDVPPADVRVLALVPMESLPVVVSTSRHITQGWVDLRALSAQATDTGVVLIGRSHVIGGDSYTLTIGLPRAAPTFRIVGAKVCDASHQQPADVRMRCTPHQGYATVTIESDVTQEIGWELTFEPAQPYVFPVRPAEKTSATPAGPRAALITWSPGVDTRAGYQVSLNDKPVGIAFQPRAVLRDLAPGQEHVIGVRSIWYDGSTSSTVAEVRYTPPVAE
jgi:hypothetical protein